MILSDNELRPLVFPEAGAAPLLCERDGSSISAEHLNSASIDIRVGPWGKTERGDYVRLPYVFWPGELLLVETWETFTVPIDLALDLRLKSSSAREGWDHSLAFWVDLGWRGVLTMELRNGTLGKMLTLEPGVRFAQVVAHQLSSPAGRPYAGRYQNATGVEWKK